MATVILSDETVRRLIEAHASLAAWYYQMADALRAAGIGVTAPGDEERKRFVEQVAAHFPEVAPIAREISSPRAYVPPPAIVAPARVDPAKVKFE